MLGNMLQAVDKVEGIRAQSASAGTINGSYIDVSKYEGEIAIVYNVGAVTGNVTIKVQDADDTSGTNVADVSGATTAALSTAGSTGAIIVRSDSVRKGMRVVATVVTGPALIAAVLEAHPKYL